MTVRHANEFKSRTEPLPVPDVTTCSTGYPNPKGLTERERPIDTEALRWAADDLRTDPDIIAQSNFGNPPQALVLGLVAGAARGESEAKMGSNR